MTNANDLAVVELTNTSDRALVVTLTLGGAKRSVATLERGASIVLVSPEGAYWSFEPTGATGRATSTGGPGGSTPEQRTAGSEPDGEEEEDDGGRGKGGHN